MMSDPKGNKRESNKLKIAVVSTVFFGAVFIATQVFLKRTPVSSPRFYREAILLAVFSALNFIIIIALLFVLIRSLIKLYFERRTSLVGSKFRTKLVFTFIALSFIPVILLSFLAYGPINKSVERWFSAPAYEILENANEIAQYYYNTTVQKQFNFSRQIAKSLEGDELFARSSRNQLQQLIETEKDRYRISSIQIYGEGSAVIYSTDNLVKRAQEPELSSILEKCFLGQEHSSVQKLGTGDLVRCAIPIYDSKKIKIIGVAVTETKIPLSLAAKAYRVWSAFEKYQQLKNEKKILQLYYIMILILATLIILFGFSWFAIYIAKRITMPIQALAEGAHQVTQGNLDHRITCQANDELEILINSFNHMTAELKENKRRLDDAHLSLLNKNIEVEEKRQYIETVMQNISTGIVSINIDKKVTMINHAAVQMLQLGEKSALGLPVEEICSRSLYEEIERLMKRRRFFAAPGKEIRVELGGKIIHLALTLTPITDLSHSRIGYVLVLEDLTELISAERAAAWQEVAKRLAHEIKNPLTPIQLSTERIQKRFQTLMSSLVSNRVYAPHQSKELEEYGATLHECVKTVTDEGNMLKHLINEFSQFARLPKVDVVTCDLHQVIENALSLYNGRLNDVRLVKSFDPKIPSIKLDPEQMKRVFVNIIDNAVEAMEEVRTDKVIHIETVLNTEDNVVRIEIADSGHGIPKKNRDDLFLPYFSTKKRGTGLGLAIVRQIISDHRGYIKAEDNKPKGARIVIEVPAI